MAGIQNTADYFRFCPGEEQIKLSNAVCRGRRRSNFPKCHGCQFNDDEKAVATPSPASECARGISVIESVFRTHDICGTAPLPLSPEVAWRIGHATAQYLSGRLRGLDRADPHARALIVGRDARPLSETLLDAFIDGVHSTGMDVLQLGIIDTPQLFFAVNHLGTCGGVMATGGADPAGHHGFLICGAKAMHIGADTGLSGIRDIAGRVPKHDTGVTGRCAGIDLSSEYRAFLIRRFRAGTRLPRPVHFIYDACNGVMANCLPQVFEGVENLRFTSINANPAQAFAHVPDPSNAAAAAGIRKALKTTHADFGVCFSPDGAQCSYVDEKGAIVGTDLIASLVARANIERRAGTTFVLDHRCSTAAFEEIAQAGGTIWKERIGPAHMKKRMHETSAVFGADLAGRFYFRDMGGCESALLSLVEVINLLAESDRGLADIVRPLLRYRSSGEIRFRCPNPGQILLDVTAAHQAGELETIDGLTVRYPDWRFHMRPLDGEHSLGLIVEARTKKIVDQRLAELRQAFEPQSHRGAETL